jgi:hypothetical protein
MMSELPLSRLTRDRLPAEVFGNAPMESGRRGDQSP